MSENILLPVPTEVQNTKDKYEWRPNRRQALFLSIPWTIKEAFYGGGAGSGKSDVLLMYGIVHRLHENPRFKQVLMRRTMPELKKEIVPRSREYYTKFGATYNATTS
jgi:predicted ribonuclease YlaK